MKQTWVPDANGAWPICAVIRGHGGRVTPLVVENLFLRPAVTGHGPAPNTPARETTMEIEERLRPLLLQGLEGDARPTSAS
jgi:hypothetical protein